ncbi:DUF885 domain-containing protein [Hirschia baltica]|uniref:DUF885 domain-containing protein n=1 Tax=Hirschia baltica (strain ATCC 49814 / DSM 5838 / IFAM 1418) TaxID=582402 RepID=C6XJK6_HIRBI|nr:DUF885 domain-containing protein [Hirschia baltica]ACT59301.1 protein of unknown function DUF885 [Hirschia baltica ATCC 49814]
MSKTTLTALATILMLAACEPNTPTKSEPKSETTFTAEEVELESKRLNEWLDQKFEEELAFSPIQKTFLGRDSGQDKIDDFSKEHEESILSWKRSKDSEMKASFDYDKLSAEAKTSYDIAAYQFAQSDAAANFPTNGYVFEQMNAVHGFFPQLLIAFHKVEDADDMDNYLSRIGESARAIDQLIVRSKENAATGVRPPYFAFEQVIEEAEKIISGAPFDESGEDNAVWADANTKIDALLESEAIDESKAEQLRADIKTTLLEKWKPAYQSLIEWQVEDKVNANEIAQGVSALPSGGDFYNERLANQTTTTLTADEIHEIGLKEVDRLRGEMEAIQTEFGFEGSLQDFFAFLRDEKSDERLYYPNTDEGRQGYIDDATAAIDKIKAQLPNYFGILPKADLEVRRVEPFREQAGAAQHYFPGTPDGSRPGIYYAHLLDMEAMPKRELEVIAYHEGLPGHHMQISIAQELEGIPIFRTQAGFTAYVEGWALYTEWLAKEMPGTYEDSLSEFGRLGSEIWRAIRLVLDTGLHSKGWTEQQAIEYFQANSAITTDQARSEVRRYMVLPGQATSYKIGMIKFQELRKKAEEELGDKFDIRSFHDTVLSGGALPLTILERRVNDWITSVKAK